MVPKQAARTAGTYVKSSQRPQTALSKNVSVNYMSPFYSNLAPADPDIYGNFVTLNAIFRFTVQTSTTQDTILIYSPSNQGIYTCLQDSYRCIVFIVQCT